MIIHILDDHADEINMYEAKFIRDKSKIIWKENTTLGFGGMQKEMACDYSLTSKDIKGKRNAYYIDKGDGKLTQISLKDTNKFNQDYASNYISSFKHAEAIRDQGLPHGISIQTILSILTLIVIVGAAFTAYFVISHGYSLIKSLYLPINTTLKSLSTQINTQQLYEKNLTIQYNRTATALNDSLAEIKLLQRQILSSNAGGVP